VIPRWKFYGIAAMLILVPLGLGVLSSFIFPLWFAVLLSVAIGMTVGRFGGELFLDAVKKGLPPSE
jgi:hypothetical protein